MICEKCKEEHDGSYGSGRFCKVACANSRGPRSDEFKETMSKKLTGTKNKNTYTFTNEERTKGAKNGGIKRAKNFKLKRDTLYNESWDKFSDKYTKHIKEYLFIEREEKCEICSIDNWLGERIVIELHHIDGNNKNNSKDNLQLLCPNCHSQTENWKGKNKRLKNARVSGDSRTS